MAQKTSCRIAARLILDAPTVNKKININEMVNRFLSWKLPENFSPDSGITFSPEYNKEYMASLGKPPMLHEPMGTNLFDYDQAKAMIEYLLTNAPTVQREGWVSVKDRFPERIEGMKILCFGNGYIFEGEYEDGQWRNIGGDDFTHWQPIPAAPKE